MFSWVELGIWWCSALWLALVSWLLMHRLIERNSKDPKTWPLLGSYLEVSRNLPRLHDWILQYFSDNHRTVKLKIFSNTCIMTVDPANVIYILNTNFQNYPKGESAHIRLYDMLGNGILNVDGDMWKAHRKLASMEFSSKKLREYSAIAFRMGALRLALLLKHRSRKLSSSGLPFIVDLHAEVMKVAQELFMRMTLTSICKVGFGVEMDSLSSTLRAIPFSQAFDSVNELVTRRFVSPLWRLQRHFKLGTELELQRHIHHVNSFTASLVHTRRLELELDVLDHHTVPQSSSSTDGSDLLSRYILLYKGESDKDLCDAILSFIIAGRDTTAITLSWFIFCICNHPRVADKIYNEINTVLDCSSSSLNTKEGEDEDDEDMLHFASLLTYDVLGKMHYLHAALTETLRLYPAVPRDGKMAMKDDILPDGTRVRAGEQVAYIPYSMGRMQFLWGEDASLYRPERWLKDNDTTFQPQSPYTFSAFQAGPRICLGRDYAYLQMKMVATLLIRFFRFRLAAREEVKYRILMVLGMANGLKVNVTER